ncbi:MAG: type II toxin-antitoxin system PemK/MazF family toxin [Candidatus Thermoplasmatota archaeon]|nr:type II toxin-antitoxin system PemK/MazF family toxin [Candidatus Thermoplasmatota archaeon]
MTSGGILVEQRDIVWVPFPFTDLTDAGKRPALVVSNTGYNQRTQDVVICAITSKPRRSEYGIDITTADLETGKLDLDSHVKPDRLFTLSKTLILWKMGRLSIEKGNAVIENIRRVISTENSMSLQG